MAVENRDSTRRLIAAVTPPLPPRNLPHMPFFQGCPRGRRVYVFSYSRLTFRMGSVLSILGILSAIYVYTHHGNDATSRSDQATTANNSKTYLLLPPLYIIHILLS